MAVPQSICFWDQCISQLAGDTALRLHKDLGEVVTGASLQQIQGFGVLAAELAEVLGDANRPPSPKGPPPNDPLPVDAMP